jgi:uncharacterized membrane protein
MLMFVPLIGKLMFLVGIVVIIFWVISFINAFGEKTAPLPFVGEYFQKWFKNI